MHGPSDDGINAIWQGTKEHIKNRISPDAYERWFSHTRLIEANESRVVLEVPDDIHQVWIEGNFLPALSDALEVTTGRRRPIFFTTNEDSSSFQQPELFDENELPPPSSKPKGGRKNSSGKSEPEPTVGGLNKLYTFDNYIVGASNEFAVAAAKAVAENPGRSYNPLFLHSTTGMGKTHLMHAIAAAILEENPKCRVVCVSAIDFINDFIQAIQDHSTKTFRKRYAEADVLLIDDVNLMSGKERSQEEFFHVFNKFFDGHKQIVLTSDRPASEIHELQERLVSRFQWGLTAAITVPDTETREAILKKKLATLGGKTSVPEEVLRFIAQRVQRSIRKLQGALLQLVSFASLNSNRPVTIAMAEEVLKDFLQEEARDAVTIDKIQKKVAEHFDIRVADLTGRRRPSNLVIPRQIAMYLARELTKLSFNDIAAEFGRDHGTIMHACKVVAAKKAEDEAFRRTLVTLEKDLRGN